MVTDSLDQLTPTPIEPIYGAIRAPGQNCVQAVRTIVATFAHSLHL